mmetsp:Transcript_25542/g.33862  ORF Transcript_25542/g.33862 Transcript_25542/m.33862 type:complete len:92 (+) Transcript_25542:830-1105(+)
MVRMQPRGRRVHKPRHRKEKKLRHASFLSFVVDLMSDPSRDTREEPFSNQKVTTAYISVRSSLRTSKKEFERQFHARCACGRFRSSFSCII